MATIETNFNPGAVGEQLSFEGAQTEQLSLDEELHVLQKGAVYNSPASRASALGHAPNTERPIHLGPTRFSLDYLRIKL